jgi:hypothetical protein
VVHQAKTTPAMRPTAVSVFCFLSIGVFSANENAQRCAGEGSGLQTETRLAHSLQQKLGSAAPIWCLKILKQTLKPSTRVRRINEVKPVHVGSEERVDIII